MVVRAGDYTFEARCLVCGKSTFLPDYWETRRTAMAHYETTGHAVEIRSEEDRVLMTITASVTR